MSTKKQFGQFYTTNYGYILQNLSIPITAKYIIEPFAGQGDLIKFAKRKNIECYDIEPQAKNIKKRDTILNPPDYYGKFVLTNPPYLARNKSTDKTLFDKYQQNDLYKCFISQLSGCIGGILIIPLNFWCSIRKSDVLLRQKFLEEYSIIAINIFEEQVFDDTSYTICSFQFTRKTDISTKCFIYPSGEQINFYLLEKNNYTIGGEIYNLPQNKKIKIDRLTKKNRDSEFQTNLLLKCIDDSPRNKIKLELSDDVYVDDTPNLSARSYATLVVKPKITIDDQKRLSERFNKFLEENREKYHSLFLTNYRENTRKRISFKLAFEIVNYLLSTN